MAIRVKQLIYIKRLCLVVLAAALMACDGSATAQPTPTSVPQPVVTSAPAAPTNTALPPPATAMPPATLAPTPTAFPTRTPTPPPTPTPKPSHPLMIETMRQRNYAGSDVLIEQTLAPGANYDRYIASYKSDGLKIFALLTVPRGAKPATGWPVIIFNHGFIPPNQYRTTERYVAYVDTLARNGYIVFRSDYRGHGSSEGVASNGSGTPDYTVDVLHAMASMKRYKDADPNRIGFWGHSMGGQITLRAMVTTKEIKAGVIWAGNVEAYADLARDLPKGNAARPPVPNYLRAFLQEFIAQYGTPEQNADFWRAISPNSFLADLSGPIQLHHGTADDSVPIQHSENLYQQIQATSKPVEYYVYEGNDHNLAQSFAVAMQRSVAFFNKHVKGQ